MPTNKILYVVDYLHNEPNSVGEILFRIMQNCDSNTEQIVIKRNFSFGPISSEIIDGIKIYSCDDNKRYRSFIRRKFYVLRRKFYVALGIILTYFGYVDKYLENKFLSILRKIIKKNNPDIIVFFMFSPNVSYVDVCEKMKKKIFYILYDTYIERPRLEYTKAYKIENRVIKSCQKYFVPFFFLKGYLKAYTHDNICSYNLPMLIHKDDVIKAYNHVGNFKYRFSYFGQISSFRNIDRIKTLFRSLNQKLHVFSQNKYPSDDAIIYHPGVIREELYNALSASEFLVVFDNSIPMNHYLPSKIYTYISFTKPIIVFGDNNESALIEFIKSYPDFYYQNINDSVDGLTDFISRKRVHGFHDEVYNKYCEYLPEIALKPIINEFRNAIKN